MIGPLVRFGPRGANQNVYSECGKCGGDCGLVVVSITGRNLLSDGLFMAKRWKLSFKSVGCKYLFQYILVAAVASLKSRWAE